MKSLILVALLVASVSALTRMEKLRARLTAEDESEVAGESEGEWDIAEGITGASGMGKVEGHELSVRQGWAGLNTADKAVIADPVLKSRSYFEALNNPKPMIMGVQMPDMPETGHSVAAYGDDYTKPTHANAGTFATLFKAGAAGARNSFIANTHYGCLQYWHAMAPEPYFQGKYKVWTNNNLSGLIKNMMRRIWTAAVNKLKAGNKDMGEFHIGRILHTIGDSYAKGHTARVGACGAIVVFQEYNAQKGNERHGEGDKPASNQPQFQCTVSKITAVLSKWAACVRARGAGTACAYPAGTIDPIFAVESSRGSADAGGSLEYFAGPEAKSKGTKQTFTAGGQSYTVYFPAIKGLARIAGTVNVADSCNNF